MSLDFPYLFRCMKCMNVCWSPQLPLLHVSLHDYFLRVCVSVCWYLCVNAGTPGRQMGALGLLRLELQAL